MPSVTAKRFVAVSPDVAYAVASDVASYREFLPLLKRSTIRGTKIATEGREQFKAELVIAYDKLNLRESFVSDVDCDPSLRTVVARSGDGPFKSMLTKWTISENANGSDVAVSVDFTLKSGLLQLALSGLMEMAVAKVMTAFEVRARAAQSRV